MRLFRNAVGVAALLLFVGGVNFLILRETLFTAAVAAPLLGAAILGAGWFVLWLATAARRAQGTGGGPMNSVVGSAFMLGICGMVYAFAARAGGSWDLTKEGRRDLAPQTVQVLESLTQPIEVVCFFVKAGDDRVTTAQDKTRRFLERCQDRTEQLQVSFIDPQKHPEQVQKYNAIGVQKSQVGSVVLKAGPRQREIPLSGVNARLEERDFTNGIINIARATKPKLYFLTGHGGWDLESDAPKLGGRVFAGLLRHESYEIASLALGPDAPAVPSDCAVLVINGFTDDLREDEIGAIDQYLLGGGRLFLVINPLVQASSSSRVVERLRPWIESRLGLRLPSNVLVSRETSSYQIMFIPDFGMYGEFTDPLNGIARFRGSFNAEHPITAGLDKTLPLSLVRSVEPAEQVPEGVTQVILLRSTPDTWAETSLDAIMNQQPIGMDPGETRGPNPVAAAVTVKAEVDTADESRAREGRAIVIGNADLTTNELIKLAGAQDLLLNSMAWLTASEELIAIRAATDAGEPIVLTRGQQRTIAWVASLGPVQAIALAGAIVLFWRRRYR